MYTRKAKVATVLVGTLIVIAGILFQASQIAYLKEEIEDSKKDIQNLKEEQIINMDENKALSEELDVLESDYRESLEEIESFEESIIEKDNEIEKLEKDLLSKKEKEAEEARLAKLEKAKVKGLKDDKSGISSKKNVATASSSRAPMGDYTVTSYAIGDGYTPGTVTANGTDVSNTIYSPEGYRVIAVDPSVIPMNSIVEVTLNGSTFLAKACDTGSAIKGKKIDLLVSNPAKARSNGIMKASLKRVK